MYSIHINYTPFLQKREDTHPDLSRIKRSRHSSLYKIKKGCHSGLSRII